MGQPDLHVCRLLPGWALYVTASVSVQSFIANRAAPLSEAACPSVTEPKLLRCWYYQHVVSHHVSTNQDGDAERDVDVEPWLLLRAAQLPARHPNVWIVGSQTWEHVRIPLSLACTQDACVFTSYTDFSGLRNTSGSLTSFLDG